jgi:ABC-type polysaccharide/polyol phosphate transport system ATPase subunit
VTRIDLDNVSLTYRVTKRGPVSLRDRLCARIAPRLGHPIKEVKALKDINLRLEDGDRLGIVGCNGAGKSTLLKVLADIYPPTQGTCRVQGRVSSLCNILLGFEPNATGRDNIRYRGYLQGETPQSIRSKMQEIGEFSELGEYLDIPVRYYSTGMRTRLGFAIATAIEPDILLIDEAFSAGDHRFYAKAKARIHSMMSRASIVVAVSHNCRLLKEVCNRLLWLDQGCIRLEGTPDEVIGEYVAEMERRLAQEHRVLNRLPSAVDPATGPRVRLLEARRAGWFRYESGHLCEGYQIATEDTVLDVGCGDGGLSEFAARCGAEVIATDASPDAIAATEARLRNSPAREFRTIVSDSNPLPLANSVASRVICMEALERVDDPRQLMAELVRVGKPGAQYLLSVPDAFSESIHRRMAPSSHWEGQNHLRVFQHDQLDALVQEAGLVIERRATDFFYRWMWWTLFWATGEDYALGQPETKAPVLDYWNRTWHALMTSPNGAPVIDVLNRSMPKTYMLVARKAA